MDSFAHAASHDLKDHLHGIHHIATLLHRKQGDRLDDEGRRQVAAILKLTQRMDTLIDALLGSRTHRPNRRWRWRTSISTTWSMRFCCRCARRSRRPGWMCAGPRASAHALCNRELAQEVFANLIGNAIKYNDKAERWVEIGAEHAHPVRYHVRDNGIGIAEADQQTIFKIFHRLHEREDYGGGAGIGLAFTRKIVERHGGRIWVKSMPGEGSTFTFTLAPDEAG